MQELILEEKITLSPVMKEIYRRLRTNLEFTGIDNKVICLTSCMANDGKSSVSFNLAKILAENDKRVLYIDADMRNSVLAKRTGISSNLKGLSHYLAGKDSGTLPEESSFFTSVGHPFPAVCIRTSTERPEALDKACFILSGIEEKGLLQSVDTAVEMNKAGDYGIPVPDYLEENVSSKVVKIIQSYTGVVNKMVWRKEI